MLRNIRSVRLKLIAFILPTVLIAFAALAVAVSLNARSVISHEVTEKMKAQAEAAKNQIVAQLDAHQKLPMALAQTTMAMGITKENKAQYVQLVQKLPLTNKDTLGTGIFMADKYDGQFFCPYAYKSGNTLTYTEDYFADNTNEGWYKAGDTKNDAGWTDPYFDAASGITMITAAVPVRDASGRLIGVATGDLDFTNVQKMMSGIRVGEQGYAMLVTGTGDFLSKGHEPVKADSKGVFPSILKDSNASLSALGETVLKSPEGSSSFTDANGSNIVYYSRIPSNGWIVLVSIPESEAMAPVNSIIGKVVAITAVAFLLLVLVIFLVARSITKPLKPLESDIHAIASGDLTKEIVIRSADEVGGISTSVNTMVQRLRGTMTNIMETAMQVASTAEQLESSASETGHAVEQVASSASDISANNQKVVEVALSLKNQIQLVSKLSGDIADQMDHVSGTLSGVSHESNGGQASVAQLISAMTHVFGDIQSLSAHMGQLMDKSNRINSIVETIQGISRQTNLLALNASIEAARAGEAGKGFAVVADEIRKLAEQSTESANHISGIIGEVNVVTRTTNESAHSVVDSIGASRSALEEVGQSFGRIAEGIHRIGGQIQEANQLAQRILHDSSGSAGSASSLAQLTDWSAEATGSIAAATQQQLATVQEQTAATAGLAKVAEELLEKISIFRV